jgi:hypothetical protein
VIATISITILIESAVVTAYAITCLKPLKYLIGSSLCANLFTQAFLWGTLIIFYRTYLLTLCLAEICIWGIETAILYFYRNNRLGFQEAAWLSLVMNLASFGIGLILPV